VSGVPRSLRGGALTGLAALGYDRLLRPRLMNWGATRAELQTTYPGDDLVPGGRRSSVMATTIDAPPDRVWPWLVQMGADRAGFYSWDHLDNGGRASAMSIHPEWQDLRQGGRISSVVDRTVWFDVPLLEPERTLVLRAALALPKPRNFGPGGPPPRAFTDSVWAFHLSPTASGGTRLVVTSSSRGRPALLVALVDRIFWHPAHWVMQTRQFAQLNRRATMGGRPEARADARKPQREGVSAG